jgi:hypothetical protein
MSHISLGRGISLVRHGQLWRHLFIIVDSSQLVLPSRLPCRTVQRVRHHWGGNLVLWDSTVMPVRPLAPPLLFRR